MGILLASAIFAWSGVANVVIDDFGQRMMNGNGNVVLDRLGL
jgi:hypothetical protein